MGDRCYPTGPDPDENPRRRRTGLVRDDQTDLELGDPSRVIAFVFCRQDCRPSEGNAAIPLHRRSENDRRPIAD